jgi:hypothetical protein
MQLMLLGGFVMVMMLVVGGIMIAVLSASGIDPTANTTTTLSKPENAAIAKWLQSLSAIGVFIVPSLVFAWLASPKPLHYTGFRKTFHPTWLIIALFIMVLAAPMTGWLGQMNQNIHFGSMDAWVRKGETDAAKLIENILNMQSFTDLLSSLFVLAFLPALSEEIIFRGILQRIFIRITQKPMVGIVITAVVFSLLHMQFLGFLPRAALGIVLGVLYWYSGSLWPAIIAHFINNALQIIGVYLHKQKIITTDIANDNIRIPFWLGLLSLTLVASLLYFMIKRSPANWQNEYGEEREGAKRW